MTTTQTDEALSAEELAWAATYFDVQSFENQRWLATIAQLTAEKAELQGDIRFRQ